MQCLLKSSLRPRTISRGEYLSDTPEVAGRLFSQSTEKSDKVDDDLAGKLCV